MNDINSENCNTFVPEFSFSSLVHCDKDEIIHLLKELGLEYLKREDQSIYQDSFVITWKYLDTSTPFYFNAFNFTKVEETKRPLLERLLNSHQPPTTVHLPELNIPLIVMLVIWKREGLSDFVLEGRANRYFNHVQHMNNCDLTLIDFDALYETLSH